MTTLFPQPDNTVCLIVDMQERLLPVLHDEQRMLAQTHLLLQGLQALGVKIVVSEQYPKGLGKTVAALHPYVQNAAVYEKTRFSACTPEILAALDARGARHVIVIGAEAHICVLQTVLELQHAGRQVHVPADCVASRAPAHKEDALRQMHAAAAVITNPESVLFQLLGDAKHPAFKAVSHLVR